MFVFGVNKEFICTVKCILTDITDFEHISPYKWLLEQYLLLSVKVQTAVLWF